MNIEFIKSEIERLSLIVEQWRDGEQIPAIERDLALDKVKSLYSLLRFGESQGSQLSESIASVVPPVVAAAADDASATEENADVPTESDVEVEFIFAEDDEFTEDIAPELESQEDEAVEDADSEVSDKVDMPQIEIDAVFADIEKVEEKPVVEPAAELATEPVVEPVAESVTEPVAEQKPAVDSRAQSVKTHDDVVGLSSLFGEEEPRRKPRSKHQRMMSIYNDDATHEKVVDISKIFDLDGDEDDLEITSSPSVEAKRPQSVARKAHVEDEKINIAPTLADAKTVTLADAMAQNTATLADTIEAPAALGEEINHSHIKSLRKAIGINDKFLMIRDLFDGDGDVYEKTLDALDGFESFDDCLLYIAENHPEWNPDSEGAKFLTQLLERKLL